MKQPTRRGLAWLSGIASALLLLAVPAQGQIGDGLVAYWNFDNETFEDSIGIFDGEAQGLVEIPFVAGKPGFGRAIKLDGEDQHILITGGEPDDLAFAGGSISIAGWFKVDAFDTSWQALIAQGEGTSWRVARNGDSETMSYAGGLTDAAGVTPVTDGEWHHFVAISDADGINFGTAIYIDGVLDGSIAGAAVLAANGQRVRIGENPGALSREWEGELDDIAIWDRVLTETEIGLLYNDGTGKSLRELMGDLEVDSDNDGMPDWWENQYGLDPNDPSDAAEDCDGDGATNLEEFLAGTDPCDTTPPTIVSIESTGTFDTVSITFSEGLDPVTAADAANYSITPALAVTAATLNARTVTLTTAAQTPGGTPYTVAVTGVQDLSKNEVAAGTQASFFSYMLTSNGVLKFSYWGDIPGTPVVNLINDPRYPATPDWVGAVYSFNSRDIFPNDSNDNYGATIEGFLSPTESGDYEFFTRSDDASEFYLSTDDSEANLQLDAFETACCNAFLEQNGTVDQTSFFPASLVAGQRYFVRMIYKEGGGGDYGQVAWRRVGDATPAGSLQPIPSRFLSAATDLAVPSEGAFTTQTPAPNAVNVGPDAQVTIAHRDGMVPWTADNVSLSFDGVAVASTFTKEGNLATITYRPSSLLASGSTHTLTLGYPDPAGEPAELTWSFTVSEYGGPVLDKVAGYPAILLGAAAQTADQGGHTGAAGDLALDTGESAGVGYVPDASWLNAATADDSLSVAFFQKLRSVRASSAFWMNSPSSNEATRGFQAHLPWSDETIYFDTSGCCAPDIQRISLGINNFPDYTGDATWWEQWHHFAFVKDGAAKRIYINGTLFHEGLGDPLPTDFTTLVMGGGSAVTANRIDGILDDFVIYNGGLTEAQAASLAGGAAPSSIPGLIAHWDFNDAVATVPTLSVTVEGDNLVITFDGTLQEADALGSWSDTTLTSPATIPATAANKFYRAMQ